METIKLTTEEKEKAILALKHYRDFLSRVETAITEDDGAWMVEQLFGSYLPPPEHRELMDTMYQLNGAIYHLVAVELEEGDEP